VVELPRAAGGDEPDDLHAGDRVIQDAGVDHRRLTLPSRRNVLITHNP
jgi:hypothetical protein